MKKLTVRLFTWLLKAINFALFFIGLIFKVLKPIFVGLKNLIFKLIVLPFYQRYSWLKNKFQSKQASTAGKIVLTFTNRHVIHILLALLGVAISAANVAAYENKEGYGQNALIYQLIGVEDLETVQEDASSSSADIPTSDYLGKNGYLRSNVFSEAQRLEEELYQEQIGQNLATTQGGTTLIKPELASTEAAKITRTSVKSYEVEEGDSIGAIANKFNLSVNTILWANNLTFYSLIKPGQKLIIPPTSGVLHLIKKGDTLASIAKKYEADESKVKEFNNLISNEFLVVGETIMVPGGRIIYTQKPRTYSNVNTPTYSTPNVLAGGKMYWPGECRRISQYYRSWIHTGVDIACDYNTTIRAAEAGTISTVQYLRSGYGYHVIVSHGGGKQTLYGHLSRILVKVGDRVNKGQVIGLEGSTGRSTGPHLHFEVRINGSRVNPLNYIR